MDHVNTEQFIDEIKSRSALWDTSSEDYKNRDLKKSLWKEVCSIFYPGFDDKDFTEKLTIAKELQGKWKILRDGYSRYLRTSKTKPGKSRIASRMYLYERQFDFLNKSKTPCSEESTALPEVNENDSKETVDNKTSVEISHHASVSCSTKNRKKRRNLDGKIGKYIDSYQSQITPQPEDADCDDMYFFRSLLPIVKTLPLRQKIKFRMDIMKMALEYTENSPPTPITAPSNYPLHYSMSQPVPTPFHNSVPVSVQHFLQSLYQMPSQDVGFQNMSNAPPHYQPVIKNQNLERPSDDIVPKGLGQANSPETTHDSQSSSRSYISVTPDLSE